MSRFNDFMEKLAEAESKRPVLSGEGCGELQAEVTFSGDICLKKDGLCFRMTFAEAATFVEWILRIGRE